MQSAKGLVNGFVVIIFNHYIFCSFRTWRSIRDYKVNESGGSSAGTGRRQEKGAGKTTLARDRISQPLHLAE
ncbi:hypothetical protein [Pseudomonas sp. W2-17]|uniref:hypothetical protein n=1 Tax=Pseudomonas sp. W2-17 TaxID=3058039 RepID=UPI0034E0A317